jgi:hypothetical protein
VAIQEYFAACCRCIEAVKLFRFLLSPYMLVETCNSVPKLHFSLTDRDGGRVVVSQSLRMPALILIYKTTKCCIMECMWFIAMLTNSHNWFLLEPVECGSDLHILFPILFSHLFLRICLPSDLLL